MVQPKSGELGNLQTTVLKGLADGQGLDEICEEMELSEITVRLIAQSAVKNLGASTIEAAVIAFAANQEDGNSGHTQP